jgi:hypothetical protein
MYLHIYLYIHMSLYIHVFGVNVSFFLQAPDIIYGYVCILINMHIYKKYSLLYTSQIKKTRVHTYEHINTYINDYEYRYIYMYRNLH